SFVIGMLAGAITAWLITKGNVPDLLAGILTMTGLYSINLRILTRANLSLLGEERLTDFLSGLHLPSSFDTLFTGFMICTVLIFLLVSFFKTEIGQAVIATGDNERMARSMGISTS